MTSSQVQLFQFRVNIEIKTKKRYPRYPYPQELEPQHHMYFSIIFFSEDGVLTLYKG